VSALQLLDLFCGEGGAGMGYALAGFEVTGVDKLARKGRRYPFTFHAGDALEFVAAHGRAFDAVHASPPCQAYSIATIGTPGAVHPDLIALVRKALTKIGRPYVIENVPPRAPLLDPITLCGSMFGLTADDPWGDGTPLLLQRHRWFEASWRVSQPEDRCKAMKRQGYRIAGVYGGGACQRKPTGATVSRGGYSPRVSVRRELMGADWMTQEGLSQAIPPAYTRHIGRELAAQIRGRRSHAR